MKQVFQYSIKLQLTGQCISNNNQLIINYYVVTVVAAPL